MLQLEAHQLQQTLIVKQDELTRLNRDNERMLTEARLLLKEQATQQDRLERHSGELAVLKGQLAQSQTAKDTRKTRFDALQSESAELHKTVSTQRQRAHSFEITLAETRTASKLAIFAQPRKREISQ